MSYNLFIPYLQLQENILPVQAFQERLNAGYCGPACLKMIFNFYGIEITEQQIANLCLPDNELGTDAETLKRIAESFGFSVTIVNFAHFETIQFWIQKKIPLIVNWMSPGRKDYPESAVPDGHFSIVIGLSKSEIVLQDPEIGGIRRIGRKDFLRVWFDFRGPYINSWENMIIRQLIVISRQPFR